MRVQLEPAVERPPLDCHVGGGYQGHYLLPVKRVIQPEARGVQAGRGAHYEAGLALLGLLDTPRARQQFLADDPLLGAKVELQDAPEEVPQLGLRRQPPHNLAHRRHQRLYETVPSHEVLPPSLK